MNEKVVWGHELPKDVWMDAAAYEDTGMTPEEIHSALCICWCNDCKYGAVDDDGITCVNADSTWCSCGVSTYDSCQYCERREAHHD